MAFQQTLILVKPDGVERGLVGEIVGRFEHKGLKIQALRMMRVDEALADKHYAEHVGKGFYPSLKAFITRGPIVAMIVAGEEAVAVSRKMMGATKFTDAEPGTIRGDFAFTVTENLVHGSDSPESAEREIALYFEPDQIHGGRCCCGH
jgi:nucleoside-diphosphate kinase